MLEAVCDLSLNRQRCLPIQPFELRESAGPTNAFQTTFTASDSTCLRRLSRVSNGICKAGLCRILNRPLFNSAATMLRGNHATPRPRSAYSRNEPTQSQRVCTCNSGASRLALGRRQAGQPIQAQQLIWTWFRSEPRLF